MATRGPAGRKQLERRYATPSLIPIPNEAFEVWLAGVDGGLGREFPAAGRRQKGRKWWQSRFLVAQHELGLEAELKIGHLPVDTGKTSRQQTLLWDPGVRKRPDPSLGLAQRKFSPTCGGSNMLVYTEMKGRKCAHRAGGDEVGGCGYFGEKWCCGEKGKGGCLWRGIEWECEKKWKNDQWLGNLMGCLLL